MPVFGHGFQAHVTSSCHDECGMRNLTEPEIMHNYITTPINKILNHRDDIVEVVEDYSGDRPGDGLLRHGLPGGPHRRGPGPGRKAWKWAPCA